MKTRDKMEQKEKNNYQPEFGKFVENCVIKDSNLLTEKTLFTKENLEKTRDFLKEIKPLFDEKNEEARNRNKQAKKKVAKIWGIRDIFDGSDFVFKGGYENNKDVIIEILLHCNWLMYLCSDRQHKQNSDRYKKTGIDEYFKVKTEWAIGPTFSGTSLDAMLFILVLILEVKDNNNKTENRDYIKEIEDLCNNEWRGKLKWNDGKEISTDAIVNVILFLCDNEKYLPIPAQNKKKLISEKLKDLKAEENTTSLPDRFSYMSKIDQELYLIREKLKQLGQKDDKGKPLFQETNPFWHASIRPFWDDSTENLDNVSDKTLLEYKKAMILYGPPGTSKSYQARKMAEGMIAEALRKKGNISEAIKELENTIDSHIHILQMHPNYTYDDFIIGKSIEDNKIVVKPGKMLQIIKGIEQAANATTNAESNPPDNPRMADKIPHFVILDEINRVDISRVFGELFTAMETSYRKKGVELSVNIDDIPEAERKGLHIEEGKLYLKVPQNMYFIGTMNMIDFSLEQVDFALRRRFLWRLSTYDPKRLDEIISEKVEKEIAEIQKEVEGNQGNSSLTKELNTMIGILRSCPDNFSKTCTDLNNEIEWENSLGKSYLIGHAFFSEIVDIVKQVEKWDNAKNILWQVSILPTLEAYCGTMDANMQETFLTRCKDAFMPKNDGKKQNK